MDAYWLTAYLILAGLVIVQSLLLALQTWEHCRYVRSCMRRLERHQPTGRVALFAPCKGLDLDLEANLRALLRAGLRRLRSDVHRREHRRSGLSGDPPRDGRTSLGAGAGGGRRPGHRQRPEGPQSPRRHAASLAADQVPGVRRFRRPAQARSGCGRWSRGWTSRAWGGDRLSLVHARAAHAWPTPWSTA